MDQTTDRWTSLRPHLERFARDYAPPAMPPLTIVHGSDRNWSDAEYRERRPVGFPRSMRGVYLLFDATEQLLYVGVAMWSFDKRPWSHDDRIDRRFIDVIPFTDRWLPLALSLEFVLIQALRPPGNTVYQGYGLVTGAGHAPIPNKPNDAAR